ncbi:Predicted thiol-disulfide oxidoreductase YuxK, DCC family [Lutibacter agarilyticus]|uniref:Predicted thiol-disulfide oxidoreductase YuxK, DCC family n=1 Tax=Lutibacter agarilyticus TaxID=1109740 RepID=A0A238VJI7_9FLAO|nr:thiol-disulfide oxidoreductase DCC family protein [Lutibacter agarilyticus]SNR34560.1 Predicted thiol-disulfide oxidoreductase YuxK, DCC family [Lutibacter agarilyticus]
MNNIKNKSIILFDGVCNLCNASVNFIIKHDKKERFIFASLQSDAAKEILLHFPAKKNKLDSVLLVENNVIYDKSTAALLISSKLSGGFKLVSIFKLIPKFIRDAIYDFIAKNRYAWFGKKETCMLPAPEIKNRFLE